MRVYYHACGDYLYTIRYTFCYDVRTICKREYIFLKIRLCNLHISTEDINNLEAKSIHIANGNNGQFMKCSSPGKWRLAKQIDFDSLLHKPNTCLPHGIDRD